MTNSYLSGEQIAKLLEPINAGRVSQKDGASHLEAYDVRAHLTRIFGFGRWSGDVLSMDFLYERDQELRNGKPGIAVGYRCIYRLTVCAPDGTVLATFTESAAGDGIMPDYKRIDAHDFAIKTAESQALKRCAINLGDQFGLSLYRGGSVAALVVKTWVNPAREPHNEAPFAEPRVIPEAHAPEPAEPEPTPDPIAEVDPAQQAETERAAREAAVERLRAAALAEDATLPLIAKLKLDGKDLLGEPCGGRLGGDTTLGELLDERADNLAKSPRRAS